MNNKSAETDGADETTRKDCKLAYAALETAKQIASKNKEAHLAAEEQAWRRKMDIQDKMADRTKRAQEKEKLKLSKELEKCNKKEELHKLKEALFLEKQKQQQDAQRELIEPVTGHANATRIVVDNSNEVVEPAAIPTDCQGGIVDGAGRTDDLRGAAILILFLLPGTTLMFATGVGKVYGTAALGAGPTDFPGAAVLGAVLLSASGATDVMAPKKDGHRAFNLSASLASDGGAAGVTCEFFDHDRTSISLAALPAEFGDEGDERLQSEPNCDGELMSDEGGTGPFANDAHASRLRSLATVTSSFADKANMITLSHPHPTSTRKGVVVNGSGRGGDFEKTTASDADLTTKNDATYLTGRREDDVCGTANLRARGGRLCGSRTRHT